MRLLLSIAAALLGGIIAGRWLFSPDPKTVAVEKSAPVHSSQTGCGPHQEDAVQSVAPNPATTRPPTTLADALAGDDPLLCAARVMAWLASADAEMFRQLAVDPKKFPKPVFSAFGREFQDAYCGAIAERWLEVDPDGALAVMRDVDAAAQFSFVPGGLLYSLASRQPELVIEKIPGKNRFGRLDISAARALETLAARDSKAALRLAEKWSEPKLRDEARRAIISGVAKDDPFAALSLAGDSKDAQIFSAIVKAAAKRGPLVFQQVVQAAGDRIPGYALGADLILQHPELASLVPKSPAPKNAGGGSSSNLSALPYAERLSAQEREDLLANYDTIPDGVRPQIAAALASVWARTDPRAAADWALAHAKSADRTNAENDAAHQVFLRWITGDADAALAWWRALPASPLRDALGTNASTFLAEEGRMDEALAMFQPDASALQKTPASNPNVMRMGGGSNDEMAAMQLGQILAGSDPAKAGELFAKLPSSIATYQVTLSFLPKWYAREPEAVAQWIEALPAGSARDLATRTFIKEAARISPEGAGEWVAKVADPSLRQSAASMIYWEIYREDPARSRRWLRDLPGVDDEFRRKIGERWP